MCQGVLCPKLCHPPLSLQLLPPSPLAGDSSLWILFGIHHSTCRQAEPKSPGSPRPVGGCACRCAFVPRPEPPGLGTPPPPDTRETPDCLGCYQLFADSLRGHADGQDGGNPTPRAVLIPACHASLRRPLTWPHAIGRGCPGRPLQVQQAASWWDRRGEAERSVPELQAVHRLLHTGLSVIRVRAWAWPWCNSARSGGHLNLSGTSQGYVGGGGWQDSVHHPEA